MKGVVLAGGRGSRFDPVTRVVNKHLLDVFDEPMIFYPIRCLKRAGIRDLVLVTGEEINQFKSLLGDGASLGVGIEYVRQDDELGIADALSRAAPYADGDGTIVMLGDNLFQEDLSSYVRAFVEQQRGARVLLKEVSCEDAKRFGVATVADSRIERVVEKPARPESNLVVTGCYMYDSSVFEILDRLTPSARGEYEITDVNNAYIETGEMSFDVLTGWWTDAGTPASKLKASILVALAKGVTFHA